jgi:DNA-binding NtrC family response regulator
MLMPHLDPPVCYWPRDGLLPSLADVRTLVIPRVDALSVQQQRDLSRWLEKVASAPPRVVSTTSVPLFEHVRAGEFLEELYYRLNTVMVEPASGIDVAAGSSRP